MAKAKSTANLTTEKKAVGGLGFIPDEKDSNEGFEQINAQTMAVPFVRIAQSGSPVCKKQNDQYIPGIEEGMFYNTLSKKVYGKTVNLIPLMFEWVYLEWLPDRGGLVDRHTPQNAARIATDTKTFGKWKHGENLLQETYTYLVLIEGEEADGPRVFSLASTALKTAKTWNNLFNTFVHEKVRIKPYYQVWKFSTEYTKNAKGEWYVPVCKFDHLIAEAQYLNFVQKERLALPSRQIDYKLLEQGEDSTQEPEEGAPGL